MSKTTIQDVARAAGVSGMTVSRVLSGRFDYTRPTFAHRAARIRRIADELGYRLNAAARSTRTGRFGAIALLMSIEPQWSILPPGLLAGIHEAVVKQNLHLLVSSHSDRQLTTGGFIPKMLRELAADGLLINYNAKIPPELVAMVDQHAIPAVWINSKQSHNCVYPDDLSAGREAAERVLRAGHRRVAFTDFVTGDDNRPKHYSQIDRYAGFESVMTDAGCVPERLGNKQLFFEDRVVQTIVSRLRSPQRPTALITYSPEDARAAWVAARLAGLSVPRDLSMVCFADVPVRELDVHFATMLIPEVGVGSAAVDMLTRLVDAHAPSDGPAREPAVTVPFGFATGRTLCPPPL